MPPALGEESVDQWSVLLIYHCLNAAMVMWRFWSQSLKRWAEPAVAHYHLKVNAAKAAVQNKVVKKTWKESSNDREFMFDWSKLRNSNDRKSC